MAFRAAQWRRNTTPRHAAGACRPPPRCRTAPRLPGDKGRAARPEPRVAARPRRPLTAPPQGALRDRGSCGAAGDPGGGRGGPAVTQRRGAEPCRGRYFLFAAGPAAAPQPRQARGGEGREGKRKEGKGRRLQVGPRFAPPPSSPSPPRTQARPGPAPPPHLGARPAPAAGWEPRSPPRAPAGNRPAGRQRSAAGPALLGGARHRHGTGRHGRREA